MSVPLRPASRPASTAEDRRRRRCLLRQLPALYIERARSDWLRAAGFELDVIQRRQNAVFVCARRGGLLFAGNAGQSADRHRRAHRSGRQPHGDPPACHRTGADGEELLFAATVTVAFIAADLSGPLRMPKSMRDTLKAMMPNTSAQAPE